MNNDSFHNHNKKKKKKKRKDKKTSYDMLEMIPDQETLME